MSATRSASTGVTAIGLVRAGVLAAGAGALALAAGAAPVRTSNGAPPPSASAPVDAAALVCPGGTAASPAEASVGSAPTELSTILRTGGSLQRVVKNAGPQTVDLERGGSAVSKETDGPVVFRAAGAAAPGVTAAQFGTMGGALSARACAPGATESWIPVGDESAGRLLTLVLVNSGSHAASVDVDVRAADGDVAAAAIVDKAVGAHSRVEVNVPADAVAHAAPVVHVRSEGGAIQASVLDSSTSGGVLGSEMTAQYAGAAQEQSVPAVPVVGGRARVRLVAPDDQAAVVRLQAWGEGKGTSRDSVVTVPAGRSVDAELTGLQGHFAAVRARSERSVLLSGVGASAASGAKDFAWAPAAPDLGEAGGMTLRGAGSSGTLVLMGDGSARTATVVVTNAKGATTRRTVAVPAGGAASLPVAKDDTVWVTAPVSEGISGVHAAVMLGDPGANGALTVATMVPAPWKRAPISVVQR